MKNYKPSTRVASAAAPLTIVLAVGFVHPACIDNGEPEPTVHPPDYPSILDDVLGDDKTAAALRVTTKAYEFRTTRGLADWEPATPLEERHLFRIASCTKPFIATLVAILHFQGRLDLDDLIADHLPNSIVEGIEHGTQITIRHLLNHNSGIFDYSDNDAWWAAALADPLRIWSDDDVLPYALGQPSTGFGTFDYSNTNYLLVGIILNRVLGHHHAQALRDEILIPLGLEATFYEHQDTYDETRLTQGHFDLMGDGDAEDYGELHVGTGLTDGGLLSTVDDMSQFIRSLAAADSVPRGIDKQAFLREMKPSEDAYGLGLAVYDFGYGTLYGHDGGTPGYGSIMLHFADHDVTIALTLSGFDGHPDALPDIPALYERLVVATFEALKIPPRRSQT
ncbi:MAG: beta-lactamase family protein [Proteobacteria bacterium]|nr:beta-lactamase family protein [Pseudomonadota bacterium]